MLNLDRLSPKPMPQSLWSHFPYCDVWSEHKPELLSCIYMILCIWLLSHDWLIGLHECAGVIAWTYGVEVFWLKFPGSAYRDHIDSTDLTTDYKVKLLLKLHSLNARDRLTICACLSSFSEHHIEENYAITPQKS